MSNRGRWSRRAAGAPQAATGNVLSDAVRLLRG